MTPRVCQDCGADLSGRHGNAKLCSPCRLERERAQKAVYYAANSEKVRTHVAAWRAANPEKRREGQAAYRTANREELLTYAAAWRAANPEKQREGQAAYRAANPERMSEWRAANREKLRTDKAAWHAANREKGPILHAAWLAANPEKVREYGHRHRALKAGATVLPVPTLKQLIASQNGNCWWCLKPMSRPSLDHYQPLALGGAHSASNVVAACLICNIGKGAKPPHEYAKTLGRLC